MQIDKTKCYFIPADELLNFAEEIQPENGTDFQLPELYRMLECDTIEVVRLHSPERWLIIDEDGKNKERPLNLTATVLSQLYPHDVIVGHAVMCPKRFLK